MIDLATTVTLIGAYTYAYYRYKTHQENFFRALLTYNGAFWFVVYTFHDLTRLIQWCLS